MVDLAKRREKAAQALFSYFRKLHPTDKETKLEPHELELFNQMIEIFNEEA